MINIVIADGDSMYLESLSKYIRSKYSSSLNLFTFTNEENLMSFLNNKADDMDILLINYNYYTSDIQGIGHLVTIILTDGRHIKEQAELRYINKYQPADDIYKLLIEIYSDAIPDKSRWYTNTQKGSVITVFSPQGGSGCTTIALFMAYCISKMKYSVFYLCIEGIPSFNGMAEFGSSCSSFSNIIFYLKEKRKNIDMKIDAAKHYNYKWGYYYIDSPDSFFEMDDLESCDYERLIHSIKSTGQFDYIIIDMGQAVSSSTKTLFNISDSLIMTVCPGVFTKYKSEKIFKEILSGEAKRELFKKTITVFNKYKNENIESCVNKEFLERCVNIPFIPDIEIGQGQELSLNIESCICSYINDVAEYAVRGDPE